MTNLKRRHAGAKAVQALVANITNNYVTFLLETSCNCRDNATIKQLWDYAQQLMPLLAGFDEADPEIKSAALDGFDEIELAITE